MATTPANRLSTAGLRHHPLVQIRRDWGKSTYQIALDGWTVRVRPGEIADVRLWWIKTHKGGERGPFSAKSRRHFEVTVRPRATDRWEVRMGRGKNGFVFQVEAHRDGSMAAYTTVVSGGEVVPRCRTSHGHLRARTLLGAPIGIDRLEVTCTDRDGRVRRGSVRAGRGSGRGSGR